MDDYPQVIIIVQNLIFYNTLPWMIIRICLIKNLTSKTKWDKTWTKGKKYNVVIFLSISFPSCWHDDIFPCNVAWRSLSWHIPVSLLSIVVGNAFINKFAKLSFDLTHWTTISSLFWGWWMKKNLGDICLILSPLMHLSLIYEMHVTLSSYNLVTLPLMKGSSHVSIVCLTNLYDIVIPP